MVKVQKQNKALEDVDLLEARLAAALKPVEPRQTFVYQTRTRLDDPESTHYPVDMRFVLVGSAGVLTSILLLIAAVRAALKFLERQKSGSVLPRELIA